jgi:hypothetical protein
VFFFSKTSLLASGNYPQERQTTKDRSKPINFSVRNRLSDAYARIYLISEYILFIQFSIAHLSARLCLSYFAFFKDAIAVLLKA